MYVGVRPLAGSVSISGNAVDDHTLTADTSSLEGFGYIDYQWERTATLNPADWVTSQSWGERYSVSPGDVGKYIRLTVTCLGNTGSVSSEPTAAVAFNIGDTLTADTDNLLPYYRYGEISYQWERWDAEHDTGETVGDDSPTYTVVSEDRGKQLQVTVTCSRNSGSVTSNRTNPVTLTPLTGTVTVSGTFNEDSLLTAVTSGLGGSGEIAYQWERSASNTATAIYTAIGSNSPTYTITGEDVGKYLRVTVRRADNTGPVSSDSKVVAATLIGTVSISGTAAVSERLTAVTGSLGGNGAISYQWQSGDSAGGPWANIGSNTSYYNPVLAQEGKYIRLTVTRADNTGSISSEEAGPIIKLPLSGTVRINGIAAVEQTLTAYTSNLNGNGTITYAWERADTAAGPWGTIVWTNSSYYLGWDNLGKYIRLTVSRANNAGSVSSEATAAVDNPRLTGTVTINGTARDGETLYADTGNLGGSGTITYQWQRGDTLNAATWTDVGSASSYTLTSADVGKFIRLTVTRDRYDGSVSIMTIDVAPPLLTGSVSISGTAHAGETLTAVTGSLGGSGTITYQWQRGDTANASAWTNVGSNSATYIPVTLDAGKVIRVTVTRSGNSGSVTSSATNTVTIDAISGSVSITGTAKVGQTLNAAVTGSIKGTVAYQWQKASSANATTWTNIVDASSSSYSPVKADAGAYIRVAVSSNYLSGSFTSSATSAVTIDRLTGSITITKDFEAPTLRVATANLNGSGAITYKWERASYLGGLVGVYVDLNHSGPAYSYDILQILGVFRVTVTRAHNSGEVSDTYIVTIF